MDFPDFPKRAKPEEVRAPKVASPTPAEIVEQPVEDEKGVKRPVRCLLVVPSGSGKIQLVGSLTKFPKVPWTSLTLSGVTARGFMGPKLEHASVEEMLFPPKKSPGT